MHARLWSIGPPKIIGKVYVLFVTILSTAEINVHRFFGLTLPVTLMNENVIIATRLFGQGWNAHFGCRMMFKRQHLRGAVGN